jgi:DNA repair exonuclease SbcCD ATPase subunit
MAFLKAHKKIILLALAGLVVIAIPRLLERSADKEMARILAENWLARFRGQHQAIHAKYGAQQAGLDKQLQAERDKAKALSASVAEWRRFSEEAQAKIRDLQGCMAQLDECQERVTRLDADYTTKLSERDILQATKLTLCEQEGAEHKALSQGAVTKLAHELARLQLERQKLLIIGPQVGYGPGGLYVGVGATLDIGLRFKVRL